MAGELARMIDGIPVVASTNQRVTLFPTPTTNQRVYNLETDMFERYTGTAWTQDGTTLGTLTVTDDTASLQDVTATQGTFSDRVQVSVSGKTTKITGVAATGGLVDGGWLAGHSDGLNLTPNDDGVSGKKLVLGYFDGDGLYRSAIEYANTTSGLATVTITPTTNFGNSISVTVKATVSALRVSASSSPASNATGSAGDIAWDASFVYVCTATNTWKRAALTGGY